MQGKRNTFQKEERLCGKKNIDRLYEEGKAFLSYPVRIVFCKAPQNNIPARCLISVPKKKIKHATDRNRIKRQIREAYRLNKQPLYQSLQEKDYQLFFAVSFIGEKEESTDFMVKKIKIALTKLGELLP